MENKFSYIVFLSSLFLLSACGDDLSSREADLIEASSATPGVDLEEEFKLQVDDMIVDIRDLNESDLEEYYPEKFKVLQEYKDSHRGKHLGTTKSSTKLWPGGKVYLSFDRSVSRKLKQKVLKTCKQISSFAKISCSQGRKLGKTVRVYEDKKGCGGVATVGYSFIKRKYMRFHTSCSRSKAYLENHLIAHEFLHILGVNHEHQHPNRDQHIKIFHQNISLKKSRNFIRVKTRKVASKYDPDSVMHYSSLTFSENGRASFVKRGGACHNVSASTPWSQIPTHCKISNNNNGLSVKDKRHLVRLYGGNAHKIRADKKFAVKRDATKEKAAVKKRRDKSIADSQKAYKDKIRKARTLKIYKDRKLKTDAAQKILELSNKKFNEIYGINIRSIDYITSIKMGSLSYQAKRNLIRQEKNKRASLIQSKRNFYKNKIRSIENAAKVKVSHPNVKQRTFTPSLINAKSPSKKIWFETRYKKSAQDYWRSYQTRIQQAKKAKDVYVKSVQIETAGKVLALSKRKFNELYKINKETSDRISSIRKRRLSKKKMRQLIRAEKAKRSREIIRVRSLYKNKIKLAQKASKEKISQYQKRRKA